MIVLCLLLSTYCILEERRERFTRAVVFKGLASLCFVILGLTNSNGTYPARMITTGLVLGMIAAIVVTLIDKKPSAEVVAIYEKATDNSIDD